MPGPAVADKGQSATRVVGLKDIHLDKILGNELTISTGIPEMIETIERCGKSKDIKLRAYSFAPHGTEQVIIKEESCVIVKSWNSQYSGFQEMLAERKRWHRPGEI